MNSGSGPAVDGARAAAEMGGLTAARVLARAYLRYVSAVWRGDPASAAFAARLDTFWVARLPAMPAAMPAAISPHGGGGHGIWWFGDPEQAAVRGYIAGAAGGYLVPLSAVPALVRATVGLRPEGTERAREGGTRRGSPD